MNQKQKKRERGMTNVQTESSGEIRCHLAAFSHHALFLWGTGPDCPLWFEAFLRCSIFLFFSLIVLCCETVSPPGRSTHSVREKRLTFNSKTSSGNRNHVINKKKKNAQVLTYLSILLYYSSYNSWSLSVVSFFSSLF